MADKEQTTREGQPQQWVPSTREAGPAGPGAPFYPSFSDASHPSRFALDAAIRLDPEGTATQLVEALRAGGAGEQLTHFFSVLRQRLEGDVVSTPEEGPLHERLQALEATVKELAEKLASAPVKAQPETYEPATPHEAILWRVQNMVRQRPEDGAKLVRTMLTEEEPGGEPHTYEAGPEEGEGEIFLMQKVAIIMVALGEEVSGEVMKHLGENEIEEIAQAIASLKSISAELIDRVLEDFEQHLMAGEWVSQGGADFARAALECAVGPHKAQEILERVTSEVSSGFYILKNVAAEQIAPFISHEHPQTVALILSQLESAQASGILAQLPERMQSDVAYRIATMENITPNVIRQIEEGLESSLRDMLEGNQDVGGPKVVADVLNLTGSSVEKNVLDQMDGQDPEVAEAVRNLMFVFDDIKNLTDREIQVLLQEVDQKDLVIALKGATNELKEKILSNMSEKVRTFITEEMEFLGPMRLSEVEDVQLRIVQQARQLEEQGQITIVRGDSDDQLV
ncbi:MAG: flagellar motor switch protein FliG [Gemmatimonadetes bacterium]|jgi:flagellar motor switch protein FliG|nr:flagellar motor switch protein FliG [Gemmatimonadota bacterium]